MSDQKIALLIDCENASHKSIEGVLKELTNYGVVNVRHAHGNWRKESLGSWIEKLSMYGIKPIQQFNYIADKSVTDSAIIIDAMDLLHSKNVDAFALMTSDSDFTPLVLRIRESGMPVYGFGKSKTPQALVAACTSFIYTDNLQLPADNSTQEIPTTPERTDRKDSKQLKLDATLLQSLTTAVEKTAEDDGWSPISKVANYLANNNRSFSPSKYGYKKLSDLMKASELFAIELRSKSHMFIMAISE